MSPERAHGWLGDTGKSVAATHSGAWSLVRFPIAMLRTVRSHPRWGPEIFPDFHHGLRASIGRNPRHFRPCREHGDHPARLAGPRVWSQPSAAAGAVRDARPVEQLDLA